MGCENCKRGPGGHCIGTILSALFGATARTCRRILYTIQIKAWSTIKLKSGVRITRGRSLETPHVVHPRNNSHITPEIFWDTLDPSGDYGLVSKNCPKAGNIMTYKKEARDIWSSLSGGAMGLELHMTNLDIEGTLRWHYHDDLSTYTSTVALTGTVQSFKAAIHLIIRQCVEQIINRYHPIRNKADYNKYDEERIELYKQITEYFKL